MCFIKPTGYAIHFYKPKAFSPSKRHFFVVLSGAAKLSPLRRSKEVLQLRLRQRHESRKVLRQRHDETGTSPCQEVEICGDLCPSGPALWHARPYKPFHLIETEQWKPLEQRGKTDRFLSGWRGAAGGGG